MQYAYSSSPSPLFFTCSHGIRNNIVRYFSVPGRGVLEGLARCWRFGSLFTNPYLHHSGMLVAGGIPRAHSCGRSPCKTEGCFLRALASRKFMNQPFADSDL